MSVKAKSVLVTVDEATHDCSHNTRCEACEGDCAGEDDCECEGETEYIVSDTGGNDDASYEEKSDAEEDAETRVWEFQQEGLEVKLDVR